MAGINLAEILNMPGLPGYLKDVESQLYETANQAGSLSRPLLPVIHAKSKRLRPALVLASTLGAKTDRTVTLGGSAIELLHLGSLVHDDVIDAADSRWGRPTINVSSGLDTAVLAGDYLLAKACWQAALIGPEAASLISNTIAVLSVGESQETADRFNLKRSELSYYKCVAAKTGALIAASCRLGGICAGLTGSQIRALEVYGQNLGISFQIIDDLLDLLSTSKLLGKPVGTDATQGTYTLPVLLSLSGTRRSDLKTILLKSDAGALTRLLIEDGSIKRSITAAKEHNRQAIAALKTLGPKTGSPLADLPEAYMAWSLSHLVAKPYQEAVANSL